MTILQIKEFGAQRAAFLRSHNLNVQLGFHPDLTPDPCVHYTV